MKTLPLLFALFLLILPNPTHSTRNLIRLPTAADDTPVLDSDGEELRAGGVYQIVSAIGGVKLFGVSPGDAECPSDVILSEDSSADPIIITPADPDVSQVLESTPHNFKFDFSVSPPPCEANVFWESKYDYESGQHFVKAGETVRSLFTIERADNESSTTYKITYCSGGDQCYTLSTYHDASINATRLALSTQSFLHVVFKKIIPAVVDTDGEALVVGKAYSILSIDEPEGQVGLVGLDDTTDCPSEVILQDKLGDPIRFTPGGETTVLESTPLSIDFKFLQPTPGCPIRLYWDHKDDPISNQTFVTAVPGLKDLFQIERARSPPDTHFYKITRCPNITTCYNVYTYKDTSINATRLVLTTDQSFQPFVFKKFPTQE